VPIVDQQTTGALGATDVSTSTSVLDPDAIAQGDVGASVVTESMPPTLAVLADLHLDISHGADVRTARSLLPTLHHPLADTGDDGSTRPGADHLAHRGVVEVPDHSLSTLKDGGSSTPSLRRTGTDSTGSGPGFSSPGTGSSDTGPGFGCSGSGGSSGASFTDSS